MLLLADICLWFCLGCVTFQDLKQRRISWFLIPLLLIGFVTKGILVSDAPDNLLKDSLINFSFIGIQLLLLTLYFSIKNKRPINIVNTYLGIGDILFFIAICAAFSPLNFIAFYVISMLITLVSVVFYSVISGKEIGEIPLAGIMALVMSILMLASLFIPALDLYEDKMLLKLIAG